MLNDEWAKATPDIQSEWDSAKPETGQADGTVPSNIADFVVGNLAKGVSYGAGSLADIPLNIGRMAYGASRIAASKIGLTNEKPWEAAAAAPDISFPVGKAIFEGPQSELRLKQSERNITPTSTAGKYGARALQFIGGSALGGPANALKNVAVAGASGLTSQGAQDLFPKSDYAPLIGALALPAAASAPSVIRAVRSAVSTPPPLSQEAMLIKQFREDGFVMPPSQINPSIKNTTVESVGGKAATADSASMKNQKNFNRIAAEDITNAANDVGITVPKDKVLSDSALGGILIEAGKFYQKVKDHREMIVADNTYLNGVKNLAGDFQEAAAQFPDIVKNPQIESLIKGLQVTEMTPTAAVQLSKTLRKKSTANLKSFNDQEKIDLGYAQRTAANLVEDLVASNLNTSGNAQLANDWSSARTLIAKVHDVKSVLTERGNVDAVALARLQDKGKPLGGGLEKIANFASAFGKAARTPEKIGSPVSKSQAIASALLGTVGGFSTGGPGAALGALPLVAPPLARAYLLSDRTQNRMAGTAGPAPYSPNPGLGLTIPGSIDPGVGLSQ